MLCVLYGVQSIPPEHLLQCVLAPDVGFIPHEGADMGYCSGIIPPILGLLLVNTHDELPHYASLHVGHPPIEEGLGEVVDLLLLSHLHIGGGGPELVVINRVGDNGHSSCAELLPPVI
jgi:hypothetical protein